MRTITITVKTEDLSDVLTNLKLTENYSKNTLLTLSLDILDSKDNYKYLINSSKIVNWDFVDNTSVDKVDNESENSKSNFCDNIENAIDEVRNELEKRKESNNGKLVDEVVRLVLPYITNFDDFSELILSVWRYLSFIKMKKDKIIDSELPKFNIDLFKEKIIPSIVKNKTDISNSSSMISFKTALLSYYNNSSVLVITNDIIYKIYNNWDKIFDIKTPIELLEMFSIIRN